MAASRRYSPKVLARICETYEIVGVEDYKRAWGTCTRVRLKNGAAISFIERMSKAEAVEQTIKHIERYGMDEVLERYVETETQRMQRRMQTDG